MEETYSCPDCDYFTETKRGLSIHQAQHKDKIWKTIKCSYCGEKLERRTKDINRDDRDTENLFCSINCKNKFEAKDGLDTMCSECGNEIHIPPSHIEEVGGYEQKNYFCDKNCESLFKSREWKGKNHPTWDGGRFAFYGPNWSEKREKALERDTYECQECKMSREKHYKKYNQDLHIHHKVKRRKIIDEDAPKIRQFEVANSLGNLITLCISCHRKLE